MIKLRAVIEIAGFPKDHIERGMQKIITNIKQEKDLIVTKTSVSDIKQINTMWSTFGEFELEFSSIMNMLNFYFDYTPSYIEIIEPDDLNVKSIDFSTFINDLLAKLHQYNLAFTNLNAENMVLKEKIKNHGAKDTTNPKKKL